MCFLGHLKNQPKSSCIVFSSASLPPHSEYLKSIMANTPHGGQLKDLLVRDVELQDTLNEEARGLKDIFLTEVGFLVASCAIATVPSIEHSYKAMYSPAAPAM